MLTNSKHEAADHTGLKKWFSLTILLMAQMGTMGDNTCLSISTASIVDGLGASLSDIAIANAMYPLIAGACMVTGGMLGLIWGWEKLFQFGALLLIIAEFVAAYTDQINIFTWVARTLSGFGASFLVPALLGLIAQIYEGKDRAFAFAAVAATVGISNTIAPIFLGYLIQVFDYRAAFYVLSGYFTLIFVLGFFVKVSEKELLKIKFDFLGAILITIGLVSCTVALLKVTDWGLITPVNPQINLFGFSPTIPIFIFGILVLKIFLSWERIFEQKNGACLVPQSFIQTPQLRCGIYMCGFMFLVSGGYILIAVPYYQLVAGFSAFQTSGLLAIFSTTMIIGSLMAPTKFSKVSCKKLCQIGILLCAISSVFNAIGTQTLSVNIFFYLAAFVAGFGCGFVASQSSLIVLDAVNPRDALQSVGVQATARNIGQTLGIALLSCIMLFSLTALVKHDVEKHPNISEQTKIEARHVAVMQFQGDKRFKKLITEHVANTSDHNLLIEINQNNRRISAQLAWGALALICFLSIFSLTRYIPEYSLSGNKG